MNNPTLFIFAGEPSGDIHGGHFLKALRRQVPTLQVFGVGGPTMRAQGMELLLPMESFEVMGFSDVLWAFPKLMRQFKQVKNEILSKNPQLVVLIDYPGFNLRLAKALRKAGFDGKIIQYISPTVWAHGKQRIQQMASTLDLLLTIYPFEAACYAATALQVTYIGNPLKEYIQQHPYESKWAQQLGIPLSNARLLSLFPGSRKGEINRNLPKLLAAASALKKEDPSTIVAISCAHDETFKQVQELLEKTSLRLNRDAFLVPKHFTYEMMRASHAALAKSGTVTLELALHRCPTVVVYQLTRLNRFIAKWVMRLNLPFYCIVNILGKREIFPELIKRPFTSEDIVQRLKSLWHSGSARNASIQGCEETIALLADRAPSQEAASIVRGLLQKAAP